MKTAKKESSTRWWEFYAVRYAVGTVVGAIIFYLLYRANPIILKHLLFGSGAMRFTLLAAYGWLYCYIASAPMLVFHAGRFLLNVDHIRRTFVTWFILCVLLLLAAPTVVFYVCPLAASLLVLVPIFLLQFVVVFGTLRNNVGLYEFYKRLSARRDTANGEITDSYRHLREHGSAFLHRVP